MFEAVILAGGKGTRLRSITGELPKPMVEVAGQPFLFRLMRQLEAAGCKKIVLSLGYRADYIISEVKSFNPVKCKVVFSVEKEPLDTGGAIKLAASLIDNDKFIIVNGDTYSNLDYSKFFKMAKHKDYKLVMAGVEVDDISRYGSLHIDFTNNDLLKMNEKGEVGRGIINSGSYVLSRRAILSFSSYKFSFEKEFIINENINTNVFMFKGEFIDLGVPIDYIRACKYFDSM